MKVDTIKLSEILTHTFNILKLSHDHTEIFATHHLNNIDIHYVNYFMGSLVQIIFGRFIR